MFNEIFSKNCGDGIGNEQCSWGAWAKDLVVTERSQWDWEAPGYTYNAYSHIKHKNNDYEDVTIFMNGN